MTCLAYVRDPSPEPVQQQLPVYDVDMLSLELVASKESTMKALKELNDSLKNEKEEMITTRKTLTSSAGFLAISSAGRRATATALQLFF